MELQAIKNKDNIKKLPKRDIFKCHIEKKKGTELSNRTQENSKKQSDTNFEGKFFFLI